MGVVPLDLGRVVLSDLRTAARVRQALSDAWHGRVTRWQLCALQSVVSLRPTQYRAGTGGEVARIIQMLNSAPRTVELALLDVRYEENPFAHPELDAALDCVDALLTDPRGGRCLGALLRYYSDLPSAYPAGAASLAEITAYAAAYGVARSA